MSSVFNDRKGKICKLCVMIIYAEHDKNERTFIYKKYDQREIQLISLERTDAVLLIAVLDFPQVFLTLTK